MRVPIESGDRKVLIVAGALLVLMTVAALLISPQANSPSPGYPSSYSTASDGAKAAYLLLGELGYKIERWEGSPNDLPDQPENALLVLAEPMIPPSAEEKWRIQKFISEGGRVLAMGRTGALLLPESDLREISKPSFEAKKFSAQLPGPVSRQAPEIELRPTVRWGERQPRHLAYYGDSAGGTVVSYPFGKGQVIWWADSEPLTNYGLTQASNLMLFVNPLGLPARTRVLWDEYFHGQRRGFVSYLVKTPAPWMFLQFLALAAAVLATYSRRSGPVRAVALGASRLSPLEFIETLGDLYQRKRAAPEALEIAYTRFRFLLLGRLGLSATTGLEQIQLSVRERLGYRDPEFFKTLQQCERALEGRQIGELEALRLIGEFHRYTRQWRLAGQGWRE